MKTMKIEKALTFEEEIREVTMLRVHEDLSYEKDAEGTRALGPLYIQGMYTSMQNEQLHFEEVLEMDVLAPHEKLNGEKFYLQVEKTNHHCDENTIYVMIDMSIHGIYEENEAKTIPSPMPKEEIIAQENPLIRNLEIQEEEVLESASLLDPASQFEDLFEDADTTYTSYRMIVAKHLDTYESIAKRYDMKETLIREKNHDKAIQEKTLVILPS